MDAGDYVVVEHALDIRLSGKKGTEKVYYSHTGYPGGLKKMPITRLKERYPEEVRGACSPSRSMGAERWIDHQAGRVRHAAQKLVPRRTARTAKGFPWGRTRSLHGECATDMAGYDPTGACRRHDIYPFINASSSYAHTITLICILCTV